MLKAAVACFALTATPGHALEIGRAAVNSRIGEPLDAHVRIRLGSGERIDSTCLSTGGREDFPEPDHALIRDVRLSLFTSQNAIRITTLRPVHLPAVSMALPRSVHRRSADGSRTQFVPQSPGYKASF